MTLSLNISEEIKTQWNEFVDNNKSSEGLIESVSAKQEDIRMLWQQSAYSTRVCQKYPQWLQGVVGHDNSAYLESIIRDSSEKILTSNDEGEFKRQLRQLRHHGHLHICWSDLVEQREVFTVLKQQSHLADHCIKLAVEWSNKQLRVNYGVPRDEQGNEVNLVVIAMGKLGGGELNFSSDIDIIFCYSDTGKTDGKTSLSNQEYFTKLAQLIIRVISQVTEDGFVYRVDCRLRPFGDSGPLVVNFNHVEDYLYSHGREWERYAYLKSRVMYGTNKDELQFNQMVTSFVYRKYIDFGVIGTLREMKGLIAQKILHKGNVDNIKLGVGGIREIEFIVQFFQLVHGGRHPELQTRKIKHGLEQVKLAGYLESLEVDTLLSAYMFLRRVENRLQMANDMQTHTLPNQEGPLLQLAQSMGFGDVPSFMQQLDRHRDSVNEIFNQIHSENEVSKDEDEYLVLWERLTSLDEDESIEDFMIDGFHEYDQVVNKLKQLINSSAYRHQDPLGRKRLTEFMPCFLRELKQVKSPALVMGRLFLLLQNILRRSVYLVLLYENDEVLKQLIAVSYASPWIASHISSYPLLLDDLVMRADQEVLLTKQQIDLQFHDEVMFDKELGYDSVLERVRLFKHTRELQVACADVLDNISIMNVSDQLSWNAEVVISGCVEYLEQKFDPVMQNNVAVIAFGKLGGIELSYGSDLDLVYISRNEGEIEYPADSKVPYILKATKFAQRLTQMLTLQTVSGKLYDVDTRLRPDGESGPIMPFFSFVEDYYQTRAWTWEIQALVRARCVAGCDEMKEKFKRMRQQIICRQRDAKELAVEVSNMREKMLETKASKSPGVFHIKNDEGGITDIEFMVQYAVLAHAYKDIELSEYSDNVRLLERLAGGGFISSSIATDITDIYCQFRNIMHRTALQADKPEVSVDKYQLERKLVRDCWKEILGDKQ